MEQQVETGQEVSLGLIAYLHRGTSPWPRSDADAVRLMQAGADSDGLVARVEALVQECLAIETDWSTLSLSEGGDRARAEMARRHPEISAEALDALRWAFTYHWR